MNAREEGFTLVELLAVLALTATLLTIGAAAVRHYWQARSLTAARDMVVTQMKSAQQRSFSESFPAIYGVRFEKGSNRWSVVRYDASTGTCSVSTTLKLDGVKVVSDPAVTDFPEGTAATACRNAAPGAAAGNEVAFFYPRGSASAGTVGLTSAALGKTVKIGVNAATGRVSLL